jgi:hypothetical protein
MTKRKTLPDEFEALLVTGDFERITEALTACVPDAVTRSGARTAMMLKDCSDAVTRWLLEHGSSIEAKDKFDNTVLQSRITSGGNYELLIELGADVNAVGGAGGTALHTAASMNKVAVVKRLLVAGATVDAPNRYKKTPLEWAMERAHNAMLPQLVEIVRALLDGGAEKKPSMKEFVTRIGERFEFTRSGFNKELLPASDAALKSLYELFEVEPIAQRVMHDSTSRITMSAEGWEKQFEELWELLVPSSGAAKTVQGEVIRIAGRIASEIRRNGGGNWDDGFRAMSKAYVAHLETGSALHPDDVASAKRILRGQPELEEVEELPRLAVAWVRANREPVVLPPPKYKR